MDESGRARKDVGYGGGVKDARGGGVQGGRTALLLQNSSIPGGAASITENGVGRGDQTHREQQGGSRHPRRHRRGQRKEVFVFF